MTTTIKDAKMDFSVGTAKKFRDGMAKYYDATMMIADQILHISEQVKAYKTIIDTNNDRIRRIEEGDPSVIGNKDDILADNKTMQARIDNLHKELSEYKEAQADRLQAGYDLVTVELFNAYVKYGEDGTSMAEACQKWYADMGLQCTTEGVTLIEKACGLKKTSARQKCKTGKMLTTMKFKPWRDIFLGALCDELTQDDEKPIIPIYKFRYVLKDKRNKKSK